MIEFYQNSDAAWNQEGYDCYYPQEADVIFLGIEQINNEPYNKWLHESKIVYINFCSEDCFEISKKETK